MLILVMPMTNLYEHFGCKAKEELYEKIKSDDCSVRSLVDFIDFSKGEIKRNNKSITSPECFVESVIEVNMPSKEEVIGVFVSTKNEPVHLSRINLHDEVSLKNTLKESLNAGAVSIFLLYNDSVSTADLLHSRGYFETFGIDAIDSFKYNELNNSIRSERDQVPLRLDKYKSHIEYYDSVAESVSVKDYHQYSGEVTSLQGFDEFSSYYARQETMGLHFFKGNDNVKDILKVGYQYDWQESFGLIACNSDGDVVLLSELFKGSPNASIVDKKVFTKELLSRDDISMVSVFHNHPSGFSEPSNEDIAVTKGLKEICEKIDIQLLDHFIVGKQKVYSFAKEGHDCVSDCEFYQKSIEKQSNVKFKQRTFDL